MGSCAIGQHLTNLSYASNRAQELIYTGLGTPYGHGFHDFVLVDSLTTAFYNNHICENSLSIDSKNNIQNIKVYPNPFNSSTKLNFNTYIEGGKLSIYDINGIKVKKIDRVFGRELIIYKENLSNGIYYLSIDTSDGNHLRGKLIVIK